jgi:iron complex outermembrane receptor protein
MNHSILLMRGVSACAMSLAVGLGAAAAQEALPTIDIAAEATRPSAGGGAPGFDQGKKALPVYREPTGQTFTSIDTKSFKTTPLFSMVDLLRYSPGLSFKWGNGPRDVVISIRGSSARNGFGVRNIVMMEDGFPITQPDGLSRTDQLDPHAYSGVDVYRGPSSALFGNYANGGAINFRTPMGRDIDGFQTGHEFGSFGYINNYTLIGKEVGPLDLYVFASDVRGDGFTQHNQYDTQTVNVKATYTLSPTDRFIFKGLHNELYGNLSTRLSLNQYYNNPYQRGCAVGNSALSGACGLIFVPQNGVKAPNIAQSADQTGAHRNDRRDVFGLRWEHDLDANTTWRTQFVYDDKNINQPTGATTALNDVPSVNAITDVTQNGSLLGMEARHFLGFYYNRSRATSYTLNVLPYSNGASGALTAKTESMVQNIGLRGREEIALSPTVTAAFGLAGEFNRTAVYLTSINYNAGKWQAVQANRAWWNIAPEASVTWRPDSEWQVYARASSGFGTPQTGQLTVTQEGVPGANIGLQPQRNTGIDAGFTWTPLPEVRVGLTGFYEWYQNELITQTPGAGLQSYTFNAPGSVHRGAELSVDWRFLDGWRLMGNYTYNNQMFTNFVEQLGPGAFFDRAGNKTPGVAPHEASARLGYDIAAGELKGLGAFVEYVYKSSYYIDNGNQLTLPSYGLVNLNAHYDSDLPGNPFFLKGMTIYFQVQNLFDRTWIAAANNISNTIDPMGRQNPGVVLARSTGSIYAGTPRAFQGGVRFKF